VGSRIAKDTCKGLERGGKGFMVMPWGKEARGKAYEEGGKSHYREKKGEKVSSLCRRDEEMRRGE